MSRQEVENRIDRAIAKADKEYLQGSISRDDWCARLGRIAHWGEAMRARIVYDADLRVVNA